MTIEQKMPGRNPSDPKQEPIRPGYQGEVRDERTAKQRKQESREEKRSMGK